MRKIRWFIRRIIRKTSELRFGSTSSDYAFVWGGRSEALKRFLVEDGVGHNPMYWRLAQSLSALYPSGTDEKRWVDGVLARKRAWDSEFSTFIVGCLDG